MNELIWKRVNKKQNNTWFKNFWLRWAHVWPNKNMTAQLGLSSKHTWHLDFIKDVCHRHGVTVAEKKIDGRTRLILAYTTKLRHIVFVACVMMPVASLSNLDVFTVCEQLRIGHLFVNEIRFSCRKIKRCWCVFCCDCEIWGEIKLRWFTCFSWIHDLVCNEHHVKSKWNEIQTDQN